MGRASAPPAPAAPARAPDLADADEAAALSPALVHLTVTVPPYALLDGVRCSTFHGTAVIVHLGENEGLILTDRNTCPIASCDIHVSFAAHPAEAAARVALLHPTRNVALLRFDLALLAPAARAALRAARLDVAPLVAGDAVRLVGLSLTLRTLQRVSRVVETAACVIPLAPDVPRFRATNQEVYVLDDDLGGSQQGVLLRRGGGGAVAALYASFSRRAKDDDR
jgi:hypothetical protein